jgi:2-polyprenyl-3-methyl-5-hydroxy-6-metoxy-1,4-benzoquinol methylase
MDEITKIDYHDFVIKNGKLVGDFEGMYRKASEIPWHQDKTAYLPTATVLLDLISQYRPYKNVCEIGSGLGYFSQRIQEKLKIPVTGFDVSPTAVSRARTMFPEIRFGVLDITKETCGVYDCVVVKEILWYVYPHLRVVLNNLQNMLSPEGTLFISQSFPPNKDYVGKEVISSPAHLHELFSYAFSPLYFGTHAIQESNFSVVFEGIYRKCSK